MFNNEQRDVIGLNAETAHVTSTQRHSDVVRKCPQLEASGRKQSERRACVFERKTRRIQHTPELSVKTPGLF